jgi:hypothetical protein
VNARPPSAYQVYFGARDTEPDRLQRLEDDFFGTIWLRNGTSKYTYRRRLDDLNDLVRTLLPNARPLSIMDVAVSSGVSTAEWLEELQKNGIDCTMVAGDAMIDAFLISAGQAVRILVDRTGFMMNLEIMGRSIRLPPPRSRGAWRDPRVLNLLRACSPPILRAALRRFQRSPASGRRLGLVCTPIKLVCPSLTAHAAIKWVEDDILRDRSYSRSFHVVRAANILNRGYFDDRTLTAMLLNLRERLLPQGLLVICRTHADNRNTGTVFRMESDGRFSALSHVNEGSEITNLVLDLPAIASASEAGKGH